MLITASVVTPYSADASERYPEQGSSCEPAGGAQESPANALARPKLVSAVRTAARQKSRAPKVLLYCSRAAPHLCVSAAEANPTPAKTSASTTVVKNRTKKTQRTDARISPRD